MEKLLWFIKGGFLAGYRTYLMGFLVFAQAFVAFAVGDISLADFIAKLPEMAAGLGLMSLRAAVPEK